MLVYDARLISLVHVRKSLERNVFIILLIVKPEKNNQLEMKKIYQILNPKSLVFKQANSKRIPFITKSNFKLQNLT
jgi:hypothetical protein